MILSWVYQAIARIVSLFRHSRLDQHFEEELATHIELATDENMRRGMDAASARRAAVLTLGSRASVMELHRETRGLPFVENLIQDLVYGIRQLRRNILVTLTVVLTLAIAIAANTTIFTVANAVLFRDPAAVADPDRLVDIGVSRRGSGFGSDSYPNYRDIARRTTTLQGIYAHTRFPTAMSFESTNGIGYVFAMEASTNYFAVLGVKSAAGRIFEAEDELPAGAASTAVLSHQFWTRRFNRNPAVIGETLRLNGKAFTVIGVAAEGFQGTGIRAPDMWVPLHSNDSRAAMWLLMGGRLKLGVPLSQAAAELQVIGRYLEQEHPVENKDLGLSVAALSPVPGETRPVGGFLGLLMGIVAIVLAIACANVSGVLLARAAARRQEIAVRLAIGAGRARIIRQLLTETVLLFGISSIVGLAVTRAMISLVVSFLPAFPFPIDLALALDGRTVVFALAITLLSVLLSGLAPAIQASRAEVVSALKNEARRLFGRFRVRNAFVVVQVALSFVLVVLAGLFVHALLNVSKIDPGFDVKSVEVASIDLSMAGYNDVTAPAFAHELADRVRRLQGVEAATVAAALPGGFEGIGLGGISVPGSTPTAGGPLFAPTWNIVEPGYFATLHIPLLAGRDFNVEDRGVSRAVVIIGEGTARTLWPGVNAVGQYLELRTWPRSQLKKQLLVIGVVHDPKFGSLVDGTTGLFAYLPLQQQYQHGQQTLVAARSLDGHRLTEEIRSIVASLNPNLPIISSETGEDYAALGLAPWRIAASVAGSLGIVGLLLASIGIYGVTAYVVTRRTGEIGIRIALGANRADIVGLILKQGLSLVALGAAIGLVLAALVGRLLMTVLFEVRPVDPITFSGAIALFAFVGLLASYVPARRAVRIDPMIALRN
jgi:predicted permease